MESCYLFIGVEEKLKEFEQRIQTKGSTDFVATFCE